MQLQNCPYCISDFAIAKNTTSMALTSRHLPDFLAKTIKRKIAMYILRDIEIS
jgi:hypothetical protein